MHVAHVKINQLQQQQQQQQQRTDLCSTHAQLGVTVKRTIVMVYCPCVAGPGQRI